MPDIWKVVNSLFQEMPVTVLSASLENNHVKVILKVPADMKHPGEFVKVYQEEIASQCGAEGATLLLTSHKDKEEGSSPRTKPNVKKIIGIASGKGGVGKSTVTVGMAHSLQNLNLKVGIVDADVQGPSIPRMMNLKGEPSLEDGQFIPVLSSTGVQCISMGLLVNKESPLIWRGPMTSSSVEKLIHNTRWKDVDVLVIDFPPGTGDVALSISSRLEVDGVLLVSTSNPVAVDDVRKTYHMFSKLSVPVLGLVENMSRIKCPKCRDSFSLFQEEALKDLSQEEKIPIMGSIPFAEEKERASAIHSISEALKSALFSPGD